MSNFLLGCNYWASNAGAFTWRYFDRGVIKKDFAALSACGVNTVRIFPVWSDFMPVDELNTISKTFPLRMDEKPASAFLDEERLQQFDELLDEAEAHGFQVIVALINGYMSGRYYIPTFLRDENLIKGSKAVLWECKFISEFVRRFKNRKCILAWEPGNECNCMPAAESKDDADLWMSTITNAIRVADASRPIFAGMHGLHCNNVWNIPMLAKYTDMLTTHPYPQFTPLCDMEGALTMRAALHPVAESVFYATVAQKPCAVEEINVLGPMVLSDDFMPEFAEKTLMSCHQYGVSGYLWWCAFDQDKLNFAPYDEIACEQNLGLFYDNEHPKPVAEALKKLSERIRALEELPPAEKHAQVVLMDGETDWSAAYGTFCLAAQCGINAEFSYKNQPLRESDYYVLPCLGDISGPPKYLLEELKERVKRGAKLLITYNGGYIGSFEELTGLKVSARERLSCEEKKGCFTLDGEQVSFGREVRLCVSASTAETLAEENGRPVFTVNRYGKGEIYFLEMPLEISYSVTNAAYASNLCSVYERFFRDVKKPLTIDSRFCTVTYHREESGNYKVCVTNFGDENDISLKFAEGYRVKRCLFGKIEGNKLGFDGAYACIEVEPN